MFERPETSLVLISFNKTTSYYKLNIVQCYLNNFLFIMKVCNTFIILFYFIYSLFVVDKSLKNVAMHKHAVQYTRNEAMPKGMLITSTIRSSRQEVFCEKGVPWNFTKFTEKHLRQSLFLNKVTGLSPATLLKKRLWCRCFLVNFAKFIRTPFLTEHLWW